MTEAELVRSIREFSTSDPEWTVWLLNFPDPPGWNVFRIERYLDRVGPYLAQRPDPVLLGQLERHYLRVMFEAYGKFLINDQRIEHWKTLTEVGGISVSTFGWYLGIAILEPITLTISGVALVRNVIQDRSWRERKRQLQAISDWISGLVG